MDDIYVTVLVDDGEAFVLPNSDGDNSKDSAEKKAKYWEGLGHNATLCRLIPEGDKACNN